MAHFRESLRHLSAFRHRAGGQLFRRASFPSKPGRRARRAKDSRSSMDLWAWTVDAAERSREWPGKERTRMQTPKSQNGHGAVNVSLLPLDKTFFQDTPSYQQT